MTGLPEAAAWYDAQAAAQAAAYDAVDPRRLHAWLAGLIPTGPALVLDVGAGSGRDAAWLAGLGHDVVAVEPAPAMRAEATRRYSQAGVRWIVRPHVR